MKRWKMRAYCLLLAVTLLLSLFPLGSLAADRGRASWVRVDRPWDLSQKETLSMPAEERIPAGESVRVSIVLEEDALVERGFSLRRIGQNTGARAYRARLEDRQAVVAGEISRQVLGGEALDVVWNLTLAANVISANVPYGKIGQITELPGVESVLLENVYAPAAVEQEEELSPQTAASGEMIGADRVWESGRHGEGTLIAIIDTGLDLGHEFFDGDAFSYAIAEDHEGRQQAVELYTAARAAEDWAELGLHIAKSGRTGIGDLVTDAATQVYRSAKVPFAANYADKSLDVSHLHDTSSEHGTHVAGIAAGNRYVPRNGGYTPSLGEVSAQGVAPDAQLLVMKVFGKSGGASDSDYLAAIEDAVLLGADAINLSLGSAEAGFAAATYEAYQSYLERLTASGTVVTCSAGNSGAWPDHVLSGRLYSDGVNLDTVGSPASYGPALAVASVNNSDKSEGAGEMSSFSGWGVPGDLSLKPELTAPGGYIRSANGSHIDRIGQSTPTGGGSFYERLSGTSMAAPQVAGMAALLAQYVREEGVSLPTGVTLRNFAISLLMSTAVPQTDGNGAYVSVLQQGAGLANVAAALSAKSWLRMEESAIDSWQDGKIKAELGDDPQRTGTYAFGFTVSNLTEEAQRYTLRTDLFTQEIVTENGTDYLSKGTAPLDALLTYTVRGEEITAPAGGAGDAQAILDAVAAGEQPDPETLALWDLDGDGAVSSRDAYLALLGEGVPVELAAGEILEIGVEIRLGGEIRRYGGTREDPLHAGAYVEGFVTLENEAESHSIPLLGYYGSWSEPDMTDVGSYLDFLSGGEYRAPYLTAALGSRAFYTETFSMQRDDRDGVTALGDNPYRDEVPLDLRRAAVNPLHASVTGVSYTLVRNAAGARYTVTRAGESRPLLEESWGEEAAAFYSADSSSWVWASTATALPADLENAEFHDGEKLVYRYAPAPEYYLREDGEIDWEALYPGAGITVTATVDLNEPALLDVDFGWGQNAAGEESWGVLVRAGDNHYLAGAAITNEADYAGGIVSYLTAQGTQAEGEALDYFFDLAPYFDGTLEQVLADDEDRAALYGSYGHLYVELCDYAGNLVGYKVNLVEEVDEDTPPTALTLNADSKKLLVGESCRMTADLEPWGVPEEVRWVAVDENGRVSQDVIRVSGSGLVTAVGAGEADLLCQAALDETGTVNAVCHFLVSDLDVELDAAVWDENAEVWIASFHSNGVTGVPEDVFLKHSSEPQQVGLTALVQDGDGALYGAALNYSNYSSNFYRIDADTWEETLLSANAYGFFDLAASPLLPGRFLAVYSHYVFVVDETGTRVATYSYRGQLDGSLVGVTFKDATQGGAQSNFLLLDSTGAVYDLAASQGNEEIMLSGFSRDENYGRIWEGVEDPEFQSLLFVSDGTVAEDDYTRPKTGTLFWSRYTGDASQLIAVDQDYTAHDMGVFPRDVYPVAGLIRLRAARPGNGGSSLRPQAADLSPIEALLPGKAASLPRGAALEEETPAEDGEDPLVHVTVTAEESAPNGLFVLRYDPRQLAYRAGSAQSALDRTAVRVDETLGRVGLAYACLEAVEEDEELFSLAFARLDPEQETRVSIAELERGETLGSAANPLGEETVLLLEGARPVPTAGPTAAPTAAPTASPTAAPTAAPSAVPTQAPAAVTIPVSGERARLSAAVTVSGETAELEDLGAERLARLIREGEGEKQELVFTLSALDGVESLGFSAQCFREIAQAMERHEGRDTLTVETAFGSVLLDEAAVQAVAQGARGEVSVRLERRDVSRLSEAQRRALGNRAVAAVYALVLAVDGTPLADLAGGSVRIRLPVTPAAGQRALDLGAYALPESGGLLRQVTSFADGRLQLVSTGPATYAVLTEALENAFRDVDAGAYYADAALWAWANGVTHGSGGGVFRPMGACTRAEMVTFLWRCAGEPEPRTPALPFTDVPANAYYEKAVRWAVENGITNGTTAATFGPDRTVTRAQAVTFLYRLAYERAGEGRLFADVGAEAYYADAVRWAVERKITKGTSAAAFSPAGPCLRGQIVTFLYRYYND